MTGFEVYQKYVAIKLHFNSSSYDYTVMNGKTNCSVSSYDKRKDKFYFSKLANKMRDEDIVPFFVSLFVQNNNTWVGDLASYFEECMSAYRKWLSKIQQLERHVNDDMKLINDFIIERSIHPMEIFTIKEGVTHPAILRFYLEGMIEIETFIYLDRNFKVVKFLDGELVDPVWEHHSLVIKKYDKFMKNVDFSNCTKLLVDKQ